MPVTAAVRRPTVPGMTIAADPTPRPRRLRPDEVRDDLLAGFRRRQQVTAVWRASPQGLVLVPVDVVADWDAGELARKAAELRVVAEAGGSVRVVEDGGQVIGFAAVGARRFGTGGRYVQLVQLHVSGPYRGRGLGRALLRAAADDARRAGAGAVYISAHPARESQAFYRAQGCAEAAEPDDLLVAEEPYDVHLELALA